MKNKKKESLDSALLEKALQGAPVGIALVNDCGVINWVNQQVIDIFGYAEEEIIGKKIEILVEKSIRAKHVRQRVAFEAEPESRPMGLGRQLYGAKKNGSLVPLEVGINHVAINRRNYFVTSITDITKSNEVKGQLQQSQKMEAVGRMTRNIVHDFKNSLSAITGFFEIVQTFKSKFTPKQAKLFDNTLQAAEDTFKLANQILDASKVRPSGDKIFELNQFFEEKAGLFRTLLGSANKYSFINSQKQIEVKACQEELEQVLMNLLTNAKDAMPKNGNLTIEVTTQFFKPTPRLNEQHPFTGHFAVISVKDNGEGIKDIDLNRIFDPFYTTKPSGKGTGLGLSIAYEVVRKVGGFIQVASNIKTGTCFQIYLPLHKA